MESRSPRVEREQAQEETPLLGHNDDINPQKATLSRHNDLLFKGIATLSAIWSAIFCVLFPLIWWAMLGEFLQDYRNLEFERVMMLSFWATFVILPLHAANLVLLKRRGQPLPTFANALYFGISAFLCCFASFSTILGDVLKTPTYCDPDDQPDSCYDWLVLFLVFKWLFLFLLAIYGVVQTVLFIFVVVRMFKTRQ